MPHSAWWAASSVSGVAVAYGRISRSIAGLVVPALGPRRRRSRCGWCSASSRGRGGRLAGLWRGARREAAGGGGGRRRVPRSGGRSAVGPHAPRRREQRRDEQAARRIGCFTHGYSSAFRRLDTKRRPGIRDGVRVGGPASFAGTNQIRFRGSVVGPHSQRTRRSPEAVFGCAESVVPAQALRSPCSYNRCARRPRRRRSPGPPARCGARGGGRGRSSGRRRGSPSRTSARRMPGTRPSSTPWMTSVGSADRARSAGDDAACSASAAAPNRAVVTLHVERVGEVPLRRPTGPATVSRPVEGIWDRHSRRDAAQHPPALRFQPGTRHRWPARDSTARSGLRPVVST